MVLSTQTTHNPLVPYETGKKVRGDTTTLREKERESRGGELWYIKIRNPYLTAGNFLPENFRAFKAEDNEMLSYCREMLFFFVLNSKRKPTAAAQHI